MPERIAVAPKVLVWARRSSLSSEVEAAASIGRPVETIRAWEAGREQPTYGQLEDLATEYGLSINALLLPAPPAVQEAPPDYRSTSGRSREPISRRTRRELHRARYLQDLTAELGFLPRTAIPQVQGDVDAATVARKALGITIDRQVEWKTPLQAFRDWRRALNELGVLVLQLPLPLDELRGLSLPAVDRLPPVILVNQSDWPNSRVFTLLHELGHFVLAHDGGICDPWRNGPRLSSSSLEAKCNRFAGRVLVPSADLEQQPEAREIAAETTRAGKLRVLTGLANRYRVSPQVVWYRIRDERLVSDAAFRELWPELRPPVRQRPPKDKDHQGGLPRWQRTWTGYGADLVSGFLRAADRGAISDGQLIRALNVGVGDVARLQGEISSA